MIGDDSTGGVDFDDIELKEACSTTRLVRETTEYMRRQAKHLGDGNITDQRVGQIILQIVDKQSNYLSVMMNQN